MTLVDIESILDLHQLNLGLMYIREVENIQEMYNVANCSYDSFMSKIYKIF